MGFGVLDREVDTGDNRAIRASTVLVEDFDAVEECAFGDAKVRTTNGTSDMRTIWKKCGSSAWLGINAEPSGRNRPGGMTKLQTTYVHRGQ